MVQILPPKTNLGTNIGQAMGAGLERGMQQSLQRNQLQNALSQAREAARAPGATPLDALYGLVQATAGIPGSERYVGQLAPLLMKQAEAEASQRVRYPGEEGLNNGSTFQRQALPEFGQRGQQPQTVINQTSQFFPENKPGREEPGNLPQEATTGQKVPVKSPDQIRRDGYELADRSTKAGMPMTPSQGIESEINLNEQKVLHNKRVDEELNKRVENQRESGELAEKALSKRYPKASPEQKAIFRKIGETARGQFKSEAEFERYVDKEAEKFSNMISNLMEGPNAERLNTKLQRHFQGSEREFEQAADDLRLELKPLLDYGLYDDARNVLTNLGYYPEERETIIHPLGDRVQTQANLTPKVERKIDRNKPSAGLLQWNAPMEPYTPEQENNIYNGLKNALKEDPKASLVLLRKALENG